MQSVVTLMEAITANVCQDIEEMDKIAQVCAVDMIIIKLRSYPLDYLTG